MIVGTLRLRPASHRRADVLDIFRAVQGPVLALPGCTACHIYEEQGPEEAIVLVEIWNDQAALDEHLRSETYRRILGAMELSAEPPEVRFDTVSATEGMELIERLRNPGGTAQPGQVRPRGL
jgi:quinol monooxygenase YgiN